MADPVDGATTLARVRMAAARRHHPFEVDVSSDGAMFVANRALIDSGDLPEIRSRVGDRASITVVGRAENVLAIETSRSFGFLRDRVGADLVRPCHVATVCATDPIASAPEPSAAKITPHPPLDEAVGSFEQLTAGDAAWSHTVRIEVIDTGVVAADFGAAALGDRLSFDEDAGADDDHPIPGFAGHGTFMAATLVRLTEPVADHVAIHVTSTFDHGIADELELALAIETAVTSGADIVLVGGGYVTAFGDFPPGFDQGWLDADALIVAPVGNHGSARLFRQQHPPP